MNGHDTNFENKLKMYKAKLGGNKNALSSLLAPPRIPQECKREKVKL